MQQVPAAKVATISPGLFKVSGQSGAKLQTGGGGAAGRWVPSSRREALAMQQLTAAKVATISPGLFKVSGQFRAKLQTVGGGAACRWFGQITPFSKVVIHHWV